MSITHDEWLAALGAAVEPVNQDSLTVQEIAARYRLHPMAAYRRVRALLLEGKARKVMKVIDTMDGHQRRVPAYVLAKPDSPARKGRRTT